VGGERRLALVVKYAAPSTRLSGIVAFVSTLARHLAERWDLHVVASDADGTGPGPVAHDGYLVHRVGFPFPLTAGRRAASLEPDATLVVSGLNDLRLAVPYLGLLERSLPRHGPRLLVQATNVGQAPSAPFARVLRRFDAVACAGPRILDRFRPVLGERAVPMFPAVDVAALEAVRPAAKVRALRVGFLNHFNHIKGADLAVAAFARLATERLDTDFVAAGTGPLAAGLHDRYGDVEGLELRGYLAEPERLSLMASCDVMLLPLRSEVSVLGISQAVLECLALGVVVVGTRTPAVADAVRHGEEGVLVGADADLAAVVGGLLDDEGLRRRLSSAARSRARADFDIARPLATLDGLLGVGCR
jgi:glycosyltransferase involved in cell wall biosynthesis